jgi:hypothetical protein
MVDILQHPSESLQDFLNYSLDQSVALTRSEMGYIYHYSEERREFVLNTWSRQVMDACRVANPPSVYALEATGIWGEAVRQRKPILVNDFHAANPLRKGLPEGHVRLDRFMTLPVFKEDEIVGVVGLANKAEDYTETDVLQKSALADPASVSAFDDTLGRIDSMMLLYERLYMSSCFERIAISDYISTLIHVSGSCHGKLATFCVQDDGGGMPEGIDFDSSPGFGLSLVKGLSLQMGGRIRIERGGPTRRQPRR